MAMLLSGWLLLLLAVHPVAAIHPVATTQQSNRLLHPFFVSVTEFNHNQKENILEISCKMFADDFEATLRTQHKTTIDITHPADAKQMETIVNDYMQKHLKLKINGKPVNVVFVGYEKEKEAVWCYLQVNNVSAVKTLEVKNDLLYEMYNTQIGIMHAVVSGVRKSTRIIYPDTNAVFEW